MRDIAESIMKRAQVIIDERSAELDTVTGRGQIIHAGSFEVHPLSQRIFNAEAQELGVIRMERGEGGTPELLLETGVDGFIIPPGEAADFAKAVLMIAIFGKNTDEKTDELIRQAIGESDSLFEPKSVEEVSLELALQVREMDAIENFAVDSAIQEEVIEQFGSLDVGLLESFGKRYSDFKEDSELTDQELYTAVAFAQSLEFADIRRTLDENASFYEISAAYRETPVEAVFDNVYTNSGCNYSSSLKPLFVTV